MSGLATAQFRALSGQAWQNSLGAWNLQLPSVWEASAQFRDLSWQALQNSWDPQVTRDDAIRWMAQRIPIYLEWEATPEQARAAGCPTCTYLGMWSDQWPGMETSAHGAIWLFERGILSMRGDPVHNAYDVLVHEMGHAVQRNHVLDAMEAERQGRAYLAPASRGCGCPGSR